MWPLGWVINNYSNNQEVLRISSTVLRARGSQKRRQRQQWQQRQLQGWQRKKKKKITTTNWQRVGSPGFRAWGSIQRKQQRRQLQSINERIGSPGFHAQGSRAPSRHCQSGSQLGPHGCWCTLSVVKNIVVKNTVVENIFKSTHLIDTRPTWMLMHSLCC